MGGFTKPVFLSVSFDFPAGPLGDRGLWRLHLESAETIERDVPFVVGTFTGLRGIANRRSAAIEYRYRLLFTRPSTEEPWLSVSLERSTEQVSGGPDRPSFLGFHDCRRQGIIREFPWNSSYEDFREAARRHAAAVLFGREILDVDELISTLDRKLPDTEGAPGLAKDEALPDGEQSCPVCEGRRLWSCPECVGEGKHRAPGGSGDVVDCESCGGTGCVSGTCPVCGGGGSVRFRSIPCIGCYGEGTVSCRHCGGFGKCPDCLGRCVEEESSRGDGDDGLELCWLCSGLGWCLQCGSSGKLTCRLCRGHGEGDPAVLWWNGVRANVWLSYRKQGDVQDVLDDHAKTFALMTPEVRLAAYEYALEELQRVDFPELSLEKFRRYSEAVIANSIPDHG